MPRYVPLFDGNDQLAEVADDTFAAIQQSLLDAGIEDNGQFVAAIVRATQDDQYRQRFVQAVRSGAWPRALVSVFQRISQGQDQATQSELPTQAPAEPGQASAGLAALLGQIGQTGGSGIPGGGQQAPERMRQYPPLPFSVPGTQIGPGVTGRF